MPGFLGGRLWCDARMVRPTQQTCSTAGPLCIIHSPFSMSGQRFLCLHHSFSIQQVLHSSNAELSTPERQGRRDGLKEKTSPRHVCLGLCDAGVAWDAER
jgi:hypothetical protein